MRVTDPSLTPHLVHSHVPVALASGKGGPGARAGVVLVPSSGQLMKDQAFGSGFPRASSWQWGQPVLTGPGSPGPRKAVHQTFWAVIKGALFENWETSRATGPWQPGGRDGRSHRSWDSARGAAPVLLWSLHPKALLLP